LKKSRFKKFEIDFIKKNYTMMTDNEIGKNLDRDNLAVMRVRKRLGLTKIGLSDQEKLEIATKEREKPSELTEHDKITSAIECLKMSERYQRILEELLPGEVELYVAEYANQIIHLEGMRPAELQTLHALLMEQVRQHRYNKIIASSVKRMGEGQDTAGILLRFEKEYNESVKRYNELQKSLDLERRNRQDISKSENDFLGIVRRLTDKRSRDAMGKEGAEMSLAALEFRKDIEDGHIFGDEDGRSNEIKDIEVKQIEDTKEDEKEDIKEDKTEGGTEGEIESEETEGDGKENKVCSKPILTDGK